MIVQAAIEHTLGFSDELGAEAVGPGRSRDRGELVRIELAKGHEALANVPPVLIQAQTRQRLTKLCRQVVQVDASSGETDELFNPLLVKWIQLLVSFTLFAEEGHPALEPDLRKVLSPAIVTSVSNFLKRPWANPLLLDSK